MTQLANRRTFLRQCATGAALISLASVPGSTLFAARQSSFKLTDAEWRKRLSPRAYAVLRQGETERPGSSPLNKEHRRGTFSCAGCALPLFASRTKFESGTGWPSFYNHLPNAITTRTDRSLGMTRTEVRCARCAGHLGHVFPDGPKPTGLRYCMNGAAMRFTVA